MAPIPFRAGGAVALGGNQPEVWVNSSWHSQDDVNGSGIPGLVWGDNAFDTIQNGSNAVAIGGMVHVAAGTYNENVVIDHSLIINGSNSGIAGNSSGRGDETIFNGAPGPVSTSGVSTGIEVTADDVVIDGVTIQGYDNGIASYANVSDLTVKNSRILDCDNGLNLLASSSTISDNYLTTCSDSMIDISGDGDSVTNNVIGNPDSSDSFNYGVHYVGGSGNISLNQITAVVISQDAIYCSGDNAIIDGNTITVASPSSFAYLTQAIDYVGNGGEINGNDLLLFGGFIGNMISDVGDSTSIDGNSIVTAGLSSLSTDAAKVGYTAKGAVAEDSIPTGCMIYVGGNSSTVANNIIGQDGWFYSYGVYYAGKSGNVSYNDINANDISVNAVNYIGDEGIVSHNTIDPSEVYSAVLSYSGDSGTVSLNDLTVGDFEGYNPVEYHGASGAVDGNSILISYYEYVDSAKSASHASEIEVAGAMVCYEGDSGSVTNNVVGNSSAYYDFGAYYSGDSGNVSGNTINAYEIYTDAVYYSGDNGIVGANQIVAYELSNLAIEYDGANGMVNAGNDIEVQYFNTYEAINYNGDNGIVDGNKINADVADSASEKNAPLNASEVNATSSGTNARIYYNGSSGSVTNNLIGNGNEYFYYGVYMNGQAGNVSNNTIKAYNIYYAIYNLGDSAKINNNTVNAYYVYYYAIYNSGANSQINNNTIDVDYVYYDDVIYNTGSSTTINGNDIAVEQLGYYIYYNGAVIRSSANDVTINDNTIDVTSSCRNAIAYNGASGSINGNDITVYQCGYYNYYYYGYYWVTSDVIYYSGSSEATIDGNHIRVTSASSSPWPASYAIDYNGGTATISDNTFDIAGYINDNIYYNGYSATITDNRDISSYVYKRQLIYCYSNDGGSDSVNAADSTGYGLIQNNAGGMIYFQGDHGTIRDNNLSTTSEGIEAYGDQNAIIFNTIASEYGIYSSGDEANISYNVLNANDDGDHYRGIEFYGEGCQASKNTIWNTSVGIEHYGGIGEDSLSAGAKSNGQYLDYLDTLLVKTNSSISSLAVQAADSQNSWGNDAVITDNKIVNEQDFGDMGILTGGENGRVENNTMSNDVGGISYYDGANATVYNNTIDNSEFEEGASAADFIGDYAGIYFGAYSGKVDSNTIVNAYGGIGIYTASAYIVNNKIDGDTGGVVGIAGKCDNAIIANNDIRNITSNYGPGAASDDSNYGGAINISPLDTYAPYGNAYIHDNTLTNNDIQFALDKDLKLHMGDSSIKGVDLATVQALIANNVLDRAFYKTDSDGALLIEDGTGYVYGTGENTYTYHLVTGWNLISVPFNVTDNSINGIFPASVRSSIVDIWGWNETAQNWVFYSPDPGAYYYTYYPALTHLKTGHAYWVEMTSPADVVIQGTTPSSAPASPDPLVPEWNLVGLTGTGSSTPAAMYPGTINVWGWNATAQNWVFYSPDSSAYYYTYYPAMTSVNSGMGQWVEMPKEV